VYTQSDSATYDISASSVDQFNLDYYTNFRGNVSYIQHGTINPQSGTISQNGWYYWKIGTDDQLVQMNLNGSVPAEEYEVYGAIGDEFQYQSQMETLTDGETWEIDPYDIQDSTYDYEFARVKNEKTLTNSSGNTIHVPTGVSVGNVNKSAKNSSPSGWVPATQSTTEISLNGTTIGTFTQTGDTTYEITVEEKEDFSNTVSVDYPTYPSTKNDMSKTVDAPTGVKETDLTKI
jgi:hypothetical protein